MKIIFCLFLVFNLYAKDIIGSIDKLDFPAFNLENVESRIDTGATNSSLHCTNIEKIDDIEVQLSHSGGSKYDFTDTWCLAGKNRYSAMKYLVDLLTKRISLKVA